MSERTGITASEKRGSALLWFGLLGGPLAWAVQLVADYMPPEFVACAPATRHQGVVLGVDVRAWIVVVNALCGGVALAALLAAAACYRRTRWRRAGPVATADAITERAHWMAVAGIAVSTLFLLMIVVGFAPPAILQVCERTP